MASLIYALGAGTPLLVGLVFLLVFPKAPYSRVDYAWWSAATAVAVLANSTMAR